jgi:hypothetical protein
LFDDELVLRKRTQCNSQDRGFDWASQAKNTHHNDNAHLNTRSACGAKGRFAVVEHCDLGQAADSYIVFVMFG